EFDFMAAAGDLDEIEEVNANCILMEKLQHASTSGTQLDKASVYDTDGSAEVQLNDNCYDNDIFIMFTQEEQYTDLLEPIHEPQLVPQNDNYVTSVAISMVQSGGTVETSSAPNEETRAHQETVYRNLIDQVAQVNMPLQQKYYQFHSDWQYLVQLQAHSNYHHSEHSNSKLHSEQLESHHSAMHCTLADSMPLVQHTVQTDSHHFLQYSEFVYPDSCSYPAEQYDGCEG
nr:hypothetical protein [Tanacetum cinerariifolium]